jgi:alkylation response protein AidB-like acyl-CoA dehydrogenase
LLAGEKTAAFGFTEPPDAAKRTTAVLSLAKRTLTVTGVKSYVSGGDVASFTCVLANVVPSEDDAGAGAPTGSAMVIVDRELPGVTIERVFETISGHTAAYMRFTGTGAGTFRVTRTAVGRSTATVKHCDAR